MKLITNHTVPDRRHDTRLPITKAEMHSTGILKVQIIFGSAKVSVEQASNHNIDINSQLVLNPTWTGISPIFHATGEPVDSGYNRMELPSSIADYAGEFNSDSKD